MQRAQRHTHTDTQTHRETRTQTHKHTHRHTDTDGHTPTPTHRQTHRHTDTERDGSETVHARDGRAPLRPWAAQRPKAQTTGTEAQRDKVADNKLASAKESTLHTNTSRHCGRVHDWLTTACACKQAVMKTQRPPAQDLTSPTGKSPWLQLRLVRSHGENRLNLQACRTLHSAWRSLLAAEPPTGPT